MLHNRTLFEEGIDIHPIFHEQDANTDITGDWIKMVGGRAYVLLRKGGAEDVDDLGLQILQATSNAGAGVKVMTVGRCWYKTGTMTGQGVWTEVLFSTRADFLGFGTSLGAAGAGGATYATAANGRVVADVDTAALWLLVEILLGDFDVNNNFKWFTAHVEGDNVNNACLMTADAILSGEPYGGSIPVNPL